jgi:hypothetical protein
MNNNGMLFFLFWQKTHELPDSNSYFSGAWFHLISAFKSGAKEIS